MFNKRNTASLFMILWFVPTLYAFGAPEEFAYEIRVPEMKIERAGRAQRWVHQAFNEAGHEIYKEQCAYMKNYYLIMHYRFMDGYGKVLYDFHEHIITILLFMHQSSGHERCIAERIAQLFNGYIIQAS